MPQRFFYMGPGAGDINRAALTTWSGQPKVLGDVAAPRDWLQSHPDAQQRYREGNPYYITIPGAPPGPFNGQYRVVDARPANSVNRWEFYLPQGMREQDFQNRPGTAPAPVKILAPNELPQPLGPAPPSFTPSPFGLGNEPVNPAPNEAMSPTPIDTYRPPLSNPPPAETTMYPGRIGEINPPPNENIGYPQQIRNFYNPPPQENTGYPTNLYTPPAVYNPPINDYGGLPTPNDFYRGETPYTPSVYNPVPPESNAYPTPVDVYNPPPNETMYPTPADVANPPPNETMYPTPVNEPNPPPDETMLPTPVDTYYPAGDGTYIRLDENGNPVDETSGDNRSVPAPLPPMPTGSVQLSPPVSPGGYPYMYGYPQGQAPWNYGQNPYGAWGNEGNFNVGQSSIESRNFGLAFGANTAGQGLTSSGEGGGVGGYHGAFLANPEVGGYLGGGAGYSPSGLGKRA